MRRGEPASGRASVHPIVDIIIVNFNAGSYLVESIQAVVECSLPIQVTVSDNGSRDNSLALLNEHFASDPRVKVHLNNKNLGFAAASNIGAESSAAPYLMFLNPDCIVGKSTVEHLVSFMEKTPTAGMCGCVVRDPCGGEQVATRRVIPDPWLEKRRRRRVRIDRPGSRQMGHLGISCPDSDAGSRVTRESGEDGDAHDSIR